MSINSGIFTILLQAGVLSAEDVEAIRAAMLKDETSVVSTVTAIRPDISGAPRAKPHGRHRPRGRCRSS